MEEFVVKFGFVWTCFFFLLMLTVGSQFATGVIIGLLIMGFGWVFWDD